MLPEVLKSLNLEILLCNDAREIQVNGRVLSKETVLNAVMLDFLSLPQEQRHAILSNAAKNLELLLLDRDQAKSKDEDVARFKAPGLRESKRGKVSSSNVKKKATG
jgi:hypothetical protein